MTTITKDKAIELLRTAAAETPDFVYREWFTECQYVVDVESALSYDKSEQYDQHDPSTHPPVSCCIVGQVLLNTGEVDEEQLSCVDGGISEEDVQIGLRDFFDIAFDRDAEELLARAQLWQDSWIVTWDEVVKLAEAGLVPTTFYSADDDELGDDRPEVLAVVGHAVERART